MELVVEMVALLVPSKEARQLVQEVLLERCLLLLKVEVKVQILHFQLRHLLVVEVVLVMKVLQEELLVVLVAEVLILVLTLMYLD